MARTSDSRVSEKRIIARLQALTCLGLGALVIPAVLAQLQALIGLGADFHCVGTDLDSASFSLERVVFPALLPFCIGTLRANQALQTGLFQAIEAALAAVISMNSARRLLQLAAPFIARAMENGPANADMPMGLREQAVAIADAEGRVVDLSPNAARLLSMAYAIRSSAALQDPAMLPSPVAELCRDPADASALQQLPAGFLQRRNRWGRFTFRAHPMSAGEGAAGLHFAVTIEREVPLPLHLLGRIDRLGLSMRAEQFCFFVAAGDSREQIADRMGISTNTAITHARRVYAKLGVQSRGELIERLRAL